MSAEPVGRLPYAIGDPGRAALETPSGFPGDAYWPTDIELSEAENKLAVFRAASIRGIQHRRTNTPRQDAYSFESDADESLTVAVVADGVGSLPYSQLAAGLACRKLPQLYRATYSWADSLAQLNADLWYLDEQYRSVSHQPSLATTIVAAAISGTTAWLMWTDDSSIWRLPAGGDWEPLSVLESDGVVHTGSVRALPNESPSWHEIVVELDNRPIFLMTDGVGTPLSLSSEVRQTLADWWTIPPDIFTFGQQVGFSRRSFNDDRTVIGIWPKLADPPVPQLSDQQQVINSSATNLSQI